MNIMLSHIPIIYNACHILIALDTQIKMNVLKGDVNTMHSVTIMMDHIYAFVQRSGKAEIVILVS
jgi:hypothetical protein